MGTRGTYGFIANAKTYNKYNHFDSYPDGLGQDVVKFITNLNDLCELTKENHWEKLKERVLNLKEIDESIKPSSEIIEKYKQYADLGVSNRTYEDWYCLLRLAQDPSIYLNAVLNGEIEHIPNIGKPYEEFTYLINLDDMTFLCYAGNALVCTLPIQDLTFEIVENEFEKFYEEEEEYE